MRFHERGKLAHRFQFERLFNTIVKVVSIAMRGKSGVLLLQQMEFHPIKKFLIAFGSSELQQPPFTDLTKCGVLICCYVDVWMETD